MFDDHLFRAGVCFFRPRQHFGHGGALCPGHLMLQLGEQLGTRKSHAHPSALELRIGHILRMPKRCEIPFLCCWPRAATVKHIGEALIGDMMHTLLWCLLLQCVGEVVQGPRSLQEVFATNGLSFKGVAAIVASGLSLHPLGNFRHSLQREFAQSICEQKD